MTTVEVPNLRQRRAETHRDPAEHIATSMMHESDPSAEEQAPPSASFSRIQAEEECMGEDEDFEEEYGGEEEEPLSEGDQQQYRMPSRAKGMVGEE